MARFAPALAAATFGIAVGIAGVGFNYAEGLSYLSNDPRACANCHIMQSQFDSWQKSSHHGVATCGDCHLPHDFVGKYVAKSRNGWNHSSAFTLQNFPEPIMITPRNAQILQDACIHCHEPLVSDLSESAGAPKCVSCHVSVGHGEQVGLGGPWHEEERNIAMPGHANSATGDPHGH
jgi:cytochrome c nitrite reductase small subunit